MNFKSIFATAALLIGSSDASSLRRNRIYDVTGEFGRFDESDPAFDSLFRELAQDDITRGLLNSMSMSLDTSSAPTTTVSTTTSSAPSSSPSSSPSSPSTPAPTRSGLTPSPSQAPINTTPGSPTTKTTTNDPTNSCTPYATGFENDPSAEVLLKIDVDTISTSTGFLDGLMDAILAALQDEFGFCPTSGTSRKLSTQSRRLDENSNGSPAITGIALGNTELPSGVLCDALESSHTCHVVYSSVMVHGTSQEVAMEGASRVLASLQDQDYADGNMVDVRIEARDDNDSVSNGVSNTDNDLDVETTVTSSKGSSQIAGLVVALCLIASALAVLAVVFMTRPRPAGDDKEMDTSGNEKDLGIEEESDKLPDDASGDSTENEAAGSTPGRSSVEV